METRFKPGVSGNPSGVPKGTRHVKRRLRHALIAYLREHPDVIDDIAVALAQEARTRPETIVEGSGRDRVARSIGGGFAQAQKLIWDRVDGLLTQKLEHSGSVTQVTLKGVEDSP